MGCEKPMSDHKPDYTGPIEQIKPGDILNWRRYEEYREFMLKKHGLKNIKLWDQGEEWIDNRQRPFQLSDKHRGISTETTEVNPFG
jgi:hypothetical protein